MNEMDFAQELAQRAVDASNYLKPPRWKVLAYRRWRKTQQPRDLLAQLEEELLGEADPFRGYGIVLRP